MSGGRFDYIQYRIDEVADQILLTATSKDFSYSKETQNKFLLAA